MSIDDSTYWLNQALEKVGCGRRNEVAVWLATQLRDNRIPRHEAEKTMKEYARNAPKCDHPYRERQAIATCNSVYRTEPRDPATSNGKSRSKLKERARKREQGLLEKFKENPLSLSRMERKRLEYSDVCSSVDLLEIEIAKEAMTEEERESYVNACRRGDEARDIVDRALQRIDKKYE